MGTADFLKDNSHTHKKYEIILLPARVLGLPAAAAKSLQSCPTLCDPMDCSPTGSSIHGIFQARVLEWGAIAFSVLASLINRN